MTAMVPAATTADILILYDVPEKNAIYKETFSTTKQHYLGYMTCIISSSSEHKVIQKLKPLTSCLCPYDTWVFTVLEMSQKKID